MKHMMVDWETLDSEPTAVVRSVGWAIFCDETRQVVKCGYIDGIDVPMQLRQGRTISWSTLCWWAKQSGEAREAMFTEGTKTSIYAAVNDLS